MTMRWKKVLRGGLALILAASAGCKQTCYLTECDVDHYVKAGHLPPNAECDTSLGITPSSAAITPPPTTVNEPERPIRYLSLAEAIAIALQGGNVGEGGPVQGISLASAGQTQGAGGSSDNVKILDLNPAIFYLAVEESLSKFDAVFTSSLNWNTTDRPVGTPLDTFQAGQQGINAIRTQAAAFSTGIVKPLPTGGVAGITFRTDYQFTNLPSRVNPSYQPALQFSFEQPLLQGFGVEINQLRAMHPGSILTPGLLNPQPGGTEGILIERIRYDESRAEFERRKALLVLNVETAYWNLYNAYWNLYAQEAALRQAYTAWRILRTRFEAGKANTGEVAQARGQYELFRGNRLSALGGSPDRSPGVLEQERQLRHLLNMPSEDGTRLVPSDQATLAPYVPDWNVALNEALTLRPELVIARQELKVKQFALIEKKNELLPDLRFTATYDINSIGTRLDGADNTNAFRTLASDHFNNWALGLRLNVPIGYRLQHAAVRRRRLELAQSYYHLQEQEIRAQGALTVAYRNIFEAYAQIGIQRAQREAYAEQLRARFEELIAGKTTVDVLLEAQRFWAQALASEYANITQYNNALASFHFNKGTLLQYDNIQINEGPLPECARERAVENQRQKEKAQVVCERADPGAYQKCGGPACGCAPGTPVKGEEASLKGVFEHVGPVGKEVPERMPSVDDMTKPDIKLEETKADDKAPAGLMVPVKPASADVTEKPMWTLPSALPLPPPPQSIPKLDDDRTLPALPPLPPPPPPASVPDGSKQ